MKRLYTGDTSPSNLLYTKAGTFEFFQDSQKENVEQVLVALAGAGILTGLPLILWGCSTSTGGGSTLINAGAIYVPGGLLGIAGAYGGEIFTVPAHSTPVVSGVLVANMAISHFTVDADPTDFEDGTPRNVHNIREITFSYGAAGSGTGFFAAFNYSDLSPFSDAITPRIPAWSSSGIAYGSAWGTVPSNPPLYRKDAQGRLYMQGIAATMGSSPASIILTLPVGYRPLGGSTSVSFPCTAINAGGTFYTAYVTVNNLGELNLDASSVPSAAGWLVFLNTITFITV